jgi:hypothetical protein
MVYGLFVVFLMAGYVLVYWAQARIDGRRGEYAQTEDVLTIQSSAMLKRLSLGYESLVADLYWLRTVQYYGGKRKNVEKQRYDLLEPLLNVATALDPEMTTVYRFGSIFLSEPQPLGLGEPEKGVKLLDQGIKNNPDVWRFHFDKGFIYLWHLKDHKKAGEAFLEGSRHPNAPKWMESMAAQSLAQGGEFETSKLLWQKQYEEAENDQVRDNARNHLYCLQANEDMWTLEFLLEKYKKRTGRPAKSLQQLVNTGLLRMLPRDPSGATYNYDPNNETVYLGQDSKVTQFYVTNSYRDAYWKKLEEQFGPL